MASFQKPDPALQTGRPSHPMLIRAEEARNAGAWGTCKAALRKVLADEPGNLIAWTNLYEWAAHFGDLPEAARAVVRVVEARDRAGDHDRAILLVTDALRRMPDVLSARFYFTAAQIYEKRRSPQMALEMLTKLLASNPSDPSAPKALLKMAEIHGDTGRFRECRWICERALGHPLLTDDVRGLLEDKRREVEFFAPADGDPAGFSVPLPPFPTSTVPVNEPLWSGEIAPPQPLFPGDVDLPPLPDSVEVAPEPAIPAPQAARPGSRPAWLLPAAGIGGVLAVAAVVALFSGRKAPDEMPSRPEPLPARVSPPAPAPAVPAPEVPAGPVVPLRISVEAAVRQGHVIVQRSGVEVFQRSFDFGKKADRGSFEVDASVPSGATELRVYLFSADRTVNDQQVWTGEVPESGGVLRIERQTGKTLEVSFSASPPPRARKK